MIVERWTWKTKYGCRDEVVKLVKALVAEAGLTPRVSTYVFGPWEVVISELEFETEQDRQKWWEASDWSQPAWAEWHKRQRDLAESDIGHELLRVH